MTPAEDYAQKRLEAEELIRRHTPERLQEELIALLRPAIALNATRVDDEQIPVGASKLGGSPDVPEGFEWPMWNGKPLGFLAQINLEQVAPFDVENLLPENGLLSFFYHQDYYCGNTGKDGWPLMLVQNQDLSRWDNLPDQMHWHFAPHQISMSLVADPPDFLSPLFPDSSLEEKLECQKLCLAGSFFPHKILGYMNETDRLNEGGFSSSYNFLNLSATATRPNDWRILLQINADNSVNPLEHRESEVWLVNVTYGITKEDLANQRFNCTQFGYDWQCS